MPDWHKLVGEHLNLVNLSPNDQREITDELAGHLFDLYEKFCTQGLSEDEAVDRAVAEIKDWGCLASKIQRAKSKEKIVSKRVRQMWIPALLSLFTSLALLIVLEAVVSWSPITQTYPKLFFLPNTLWFVSLFIIGSASAYLSRRAHGSRSMSVAVAIFPSMAMALVWLTLLAFTVVRRLPFQSIAFGYGFLHAVIIPGICLFAGTIPFLKTNRADRLAS